MFNILNSILVLTFLKLLKLSHSCSLNDTRYVYKQSQTLSISFFNQLNELNFSNCSQRSIDVSVLEITTYNAEIVLSDGLNLNGLVIRPVEKWLLFKFFRFKGYDLASYSFLNLKTTNNHSPHNIWVALGGLNFYFYLNNQLVEDDLCDYYKIPNQTLLTNVAFLEQTNYPKFSTSTCPFIFKNAFLRLLSLGHISNSFLSHNLLEFQNKTIYSLNSTILQLNLKIYRADLNRKLFHQYVFINLTVCDLNGIIDSIETETFKNLPSLKILRIRTQNIKKLFISNNNWLNYLNSQVLIDVKNKSDAVENIGKSFILIMDQMFENTTYYDYPNEDICYVRDFPHSRFILPELKPAYKSSCTCTELFLIQYSFKFAYLVEYFEVTVPSLYSFTEFYQDSTFSSIYLKCQDSIRKGEHIRCNFEKRFNLCNIETISAPQNTLQIYMYDWYEIFASVRYYLRFNINVVFSIVVFFINLITIVIFESAKMKHKMYAYLKIHICFNLYLSLTSIFKILVNNCVENRYCFLYKISVWSQYFNIIIYKLISKSAKTSSNLAHISFTLSRYITISGLKNPFLNRLTSLSTKPYLLIIVTSSILVNVYSCFQYSITHSESNIKEFHYFDVKNTLDLKMDPIDDYRDIYSSSELVVLNIFQFIKIIFSDLSYIILISLIDILLLVFVKKNIKKKKKLNSKTSDMKISRNRITKMIILNGLNYVVFRFPSAWFEFYGLLFRYDIQTRKYSPNLSTFLICKVFKACESLDNLFYLLYIFSFFIQFWVFLKFDRIFYESFKSILTKIKRNIFKSNTISSSLKYFNTKTIFDAKSKLAKN